MRKLLSAILLIVLNTLVISAVEPTSTDGITRVFSDAPETIVDDLPQMVRFDMIDYFNSKMDVKSANKFDKKFGIKSIDDEMLIYESEDSAIRTAIVLLVGAKSDTTIMVVHTLARPLPDSEITFYNRAWQPTKKVKFSEPKLADWTQGDKSLLNTLREQLPFMTAVATYSPAEHQLSFEPTIEQFFIKDEVPESLGMIAPRLVYIWNGKSFKKQQ